MNTMKNLAYLFIAASVLFACNDESLKNIYDNIGDKEEKQNIEYLLTSSDYSTISLAALAKAVTTADSTLARSVNSAKALNEFASANEYVPSILAKVYSGLDKGSTAKVTYSYKTGSSDFYKLTATDYTVIWDGISTVGALSPSKPLKEAVPALFAEKYPNAQDGDVKIVEYEYSAIDPGEQVSTITVFSDDFESYTEVGSGKAVATTHFIINQDFGAATETGSNKVWECRTFSDNKYAQISANGSKKENISWLVTPRLDLTSATDNASFSFDICVGYFNANIFKVLLSENFDGTADGIASATWIDITANFSIPQEPVSGYGVLATAGTMDLKAYAGKKVYIAFKYEGNGIGNVATTTYQIDNVSVEYTAVSTVVGEKETRYAYLKRDAGVWNVETKDIYVLTADDYSAIGKTSITAADAGKYLPVLLNQKYPYAQASDKKVVAYKTSATANTAEEYVYNAGAWAPVSLIVERTEQFVRGNSGWLFDPTVVLTVVRGKTAEVQKFIDYVRTEMPDKWYPYPNRTNEEHYYGFNAYYGEIACDNYRLTYGDDEIKNCETAEEREVLFMKRAEEGLVLFASINYPSMKSDVAGVEQLLKVRIEHYFSSSDHRYFEHTLKCIKPGTGEDSRAEFEYVSREQVTAL